MTYYIKYRPQTLDDLDQEGVRESLKKTVSSGQIPHAFLFSGPKGTGKTSAARILAKVVNCEDPGKNGSPCNKCTQCTSISKGQNIDVIELDAASHRGIDDVRSLREAVKLSPARAKKKVYIVDEAHMLTTEASNALLKTLEEPPDHVIFILATTNPEKLIDTIRSRSTNIVFKKASSEELVTSLKKIAKAEKIPVSESVLKQIAKSADGSFRDAHVTLERLVTEGKDLSQKGGVDAFLFGQSAFNVDSFLAELADRNAISAIEMLEEASSKGASAKDITVTILDTLRSSLLSQYGIGEGSAKSEFTKDEMISLIKLLSESLSKLSNSVIEQVPLEIAVIEWCEGIGGEGGKDKVEKIPAKKDLDKNSESSKKVNEEQKEIKENSQDSDVEIEVQEPNGSEENGKRNIIPETQNGGSMDDKTWSLILSKIGPEHASTEALLKAARPMEFDGAVLKLGVYYKFHKEHLEGNQHRSVLERVLASHLGNDVRVVCTLTEPPIKKSPPVGMNGNSVEAHKAPEVLLTEPEGAKVGTNPTLTAGGGEDIITLAEKIFGN